MLKLYRFFILVFIITNNSCFAYDDAIKKYLTNSQLVGKGTLRYYLWTIYDAEFYAPDGKFAYDKPFALVITYRKTLHGKDIAKRSVDEMRRVGMTDETKLKKWLILMEGFFPDVKNGVSITGIYLLTGKTIFYKDQEKIAEIDDPEFGKWFFNIWLDPKSTDQQLRREIFNSKS